MLVEHPLGAAQLPQCFPAPSLVGEHHPVDQMRLAGVAGVSDPVARDLERDLGLVQRVEQADCLEPRAVLLGAVAQPAPVYFARVDQPLLLAQQRDLPPVGEREGGVAPFCSGVADEGAVAPARSSLEVCQVEPRGRVAR